MKEGGCVDDSILASVGELHTVPKLFALYVRQVKGNSCSNHNWYLNPEHKLFKSVSSRFTTIGGFIEGTQPPPVHWSH